MAYATRIPTTQDIRAELAKAIYALSASDQTLFREAFPTPIQDHDVDEALRSAMDIAEKALR